MPRRNEMEIAITGDINEINRSLKRLEGRVDQFAKNTEKNLTSGFNQFLKFTVPGINHAAQLISRSLQSIGRAIAKPIETSAEFEFLETRLTSLFGSVEEGSKAFENFNKFSAKTPFQVREVVEAGATLQAFLGKEGDSRTLIGGIGDLAAYMGITIPEAASAFGRAFAGGAGAAEMLRDRGILQLIKSFKGIDDITKLTLPEFREALIDAMQDTSLGIAGSTERLSKTWIGAYSNMQDAVDRMWDAIGDLMTKRLRPLLTIVSDLAGKVRDFFRAMTETPLDKTIRELKEMGQATAKYELTLAKIEERRASMLAKGLNEEEVQKRIADLSERQMDLTIQIADEQAKLVEAGQSEELLKQKIADWQSILNLRISETGLKAHRMAQAGIADAQASLDKLNSLKLQREETAGLLEIATKELTLVENLNLSKDQVAKLEALIAEMREKSKKAQEEIVEAGKEEVVIKTEVVKAEEKDKDLREQIIETEKGFSGILRDQIKGLFAKLIASVLGAEAKKGILGIPTAAIASAAFLALWSKLVPKFAGGGQFITHGPQVMMVGEAGPEEVKVSPIAGGEGGPQVTLQILGGVVDDAYVRNELIPALNRALQTGSVRLVR